MSSTYLGQKIKLRISEIFNMFISTLILYMHFSFAFNFNTVTKPIEISYLNTQD